MNEQYNKIVKNKSKSVWGTSPAGSTFGQGHEKGTKEFFESVLQKRFSYECNWFNEVVNFKRFQGKKVLEIGYGAGYDAYMFCKHGANYTGIDITPENQIIATKHLSYYGYQPKLLCMDVEKMSFNEEFDYVFSFGVLHHTPNIKRALENIHKALKIGGKAQIIVYHKYSIFYLLNVIFTEWITKGGLLKRTLAEQRSLIEYTESSERPLVNVYSKKQIGQLLIDTGFKIEQYHIRKLVHEDIKSIRFIGRISNFIPKNFLNFIGKKLGWYISVHAIK